MNTNEYQIGKTHMGCFDTGEDLLEGIERFAADRNIRVARITVIGAVRTAVVAYYDQTVREYQEVTFGEPMEILGCLGNLSLKEGKPIAHLHAVFGDSQGQTRGGHVRPGTDVFFAEVIIEELEGPELHRGYDPVTGLPAWEL